MDKQSMLSKERRFTETEVVCLREWLIAALRGDARRAIDILETGLHFEHWDALLSEHPAERTPEQVAQFDRYKADFVRALGPNVEVPQDILDARHEVVGGQDVRE